MYAFVLMPFETAFDDIYKLGIKETAEKLGIRAERVDEQIFHKENILERIYSQIDAADLIIADLTGRNPKRSVPRLLATAACRWKFASPLCKQQENGVGHAD